MKYKQTLPRNVEKQLDEYIERIRAIKWFKVSPDIKREAVDKQVNVVLEAFGVKASIEYRSLKDSKDWDAAWEAAWHAARDAAWHAARDAALDAALDAAAVRYVAWDAAWFAARDAAWDVAWDVARDAAWDAARGAEDVLTLNLDSYKSKYPNGSFVNIITLWEMGLYPCGVVCGKFVVYVPEKDREIPQLTDMAAVNIPIRAGQGGALTAGKKL